MADPMSPEGAKRPDHRLEGVAPGRQQSPPIEVATMAGAIERAAADLALAEEPSGFVTALEEGARPAEGDGDV